MDNIIYGNFIKSEPITKGWSEDKKYCVTVADGTKYLLRISPMDRYETKKLLFNITEQIAALGVPMCVPIEFGACDDGVYTIQSWIDGKDLSDALPELSETEQYILGIKSGEILRKIHMISAPDTIANGIGAEDWEIRYNRKTDIQIKKYYECGLRFNGDERVIAYIEQNRYLLKNRPQCFHHGDYFIGNMMLEQGELKIIDFERYYFGDPWEEFFYIMLGAAENPHFITGQFRGYFNGEPPLEFFKLLTLYIVNDLLPFIYEADPSGQSELDTLMTRAQNVLGWFDNMNNPVPTWYLKDFCVQHIDGIPYKLKEPFDFSFISKYGKVFKIFDNQDSGNICFCTTNGENKYFVKFAGSPTERACVSVEEAVVNLKCTVPIYKNLAHKNLVKFIDAEEIGGGYAVIFEWVDAECMHPMYPLSREKFLEMALDTRCQVFEDILAFHTYVTKQGYVAIDFYDGSIMYDFINNKTIICDIDFYSKTPYINKMGRLWGSSRFMSPEEFELGAVIDEITNVYAMGATAFALFGDEKDRCIEKWRLNKALYDVAKKAVSNEREKRQQSIEQFIEEWGEAKSE